MVSDRRDLRIRRSGAVHTEGKRGAARRRERAESNDEVRTARMTFEASTTRTPASPDPEVGLGDMQLIAARVRLGAEGRGRLARAVPSLIFGVS